MTSETQPPNLPTTRKLMKASLAAIVAAAAIFVTVVLPAEFGIDPLGTGALLGIKTMSAAVVVAEEKFQTAASGLGAVPITEGPVTHYAEPYNYNSAEFVLQPKQGVEYKYYLPKGASLIYSWKATAPVNHDFHGEPDTYPNDPSVSYDKSVKSGSNGSFIAPFSGIHGWYWQNTGSEPVTVKVSGVGFFEYAVELGPNSFRKKHDSMSAADMIAAANKGASK